MTQASKLRDAIGTFLTNRRADSPFLLDRYTVDLETQIMTSRDGEPGEDTGDYTADGETWRDKRWPYQAGSNPTFNDPPLTFDPSKRVERVGTTWWDFEQKKSIAVGIDIDYSEGHAATTNTNDSDTLAAIVDKLSALDYVTIVRSTGGKGLHVYVFFDNPPDAANHHEHSIVARKTLELIGQDIDYPLKDHVDCVGSVFWIWSKSSPAGHPGFELVKEGGKLDASRLLSINLPTLTARKNEQADFDIVAFDDEHKRILEAIAAQGGFFNIRPDMNLVQTHTVAIKRAVDQGLIPGPFETASDGTDLRSPNCFLAPQLGGSFRVVRFGETRHEPSWEWNPTTRKNFCFLNDPSSVQEIISEVATKKVGDKYELNADGVQEICARLGESFTGPVPVDVWATLLPCGDIQLNSKEGADGWERQGKLFVKTIHAPAKVGDFKARILRRADDYFRYVVHGGVAGGWYMKTDSGQWLRHKSFGDISCVVDGTMGEFSKKAHEFAQRNPWNMTKVPFQAEYPGGRTWNFEAPTFAVDPAETAGKHEHFDMILKHIGGELDEVVQNHNWCRKANILSGADYLRTWLACLIHCPDQPLPYLFLSGPQNSGKSVFHECTRFLFTHGVTSAGRALTSEFNGELEGCFLVYVEERDLGDKRHDSYSKIKEWVTGREIAIRPLYQQQYTTENYLHFVQMANNPDHLPIEDGDTRIIALEVPALEKPIPKAILESHLRAEAPAFLRTLLDTVIPPPVDRLRIPTLPTTTKLLMEQKAMSPLMAFCKKNVISCAGHKIELEQEFYKRYVSDHAAQTGGDPDPFFLAHQELATRSDRFVIGRRGSKVYLLNATFDRQAKPKKTPLKVNEHGRF